MTDPVLQMMIDAGLVDEKEAALKDQLATAKALRGTQMPQGRMVGNVFVASSPFEMAAAALNQGVGAYKERKIGQERTALADTRRQGREAAAGEYGQPGTAIDTAGLLGADDASFAEQQKALIAALRGEQARATQGMASGDPIISGMARDALGDARRREEQLSGLAGSRLQRARERLKMEQDKAQQDREYGLQRDALTQKGGQFDRNLAFEREKLAAEMDAKRAAAEAKAREDGGKDADSLRKELQGQQGYKDYQTVAQAYEKILATSPTGAGDISLVYGYMKLLDPGSTVREGEFATAANAGSAFEKIGGLYNQVLRGEKLPDNVRQQFRAEAGRVFGAQKQRYDALVAPYRDYAAKRGIDPGDVIFAGGEPAPAQSAAAPTRKTVNGKTYEQRADGWYEVQ